MVNNIITQQGGKFQLRKQIIAHLPTDYLSYVEPFCGGAWVFLGLQKTCREALSDLNPYVIQFYKDLQNKSAVDDFIALLQEYHKSPPKVFHEIFLRYRDKKKSGEKNNLSLFEYFILSRMSFGGSYDSFCQRADRDDFKESNRNDFTGVLRKLPLLVERLKNVTLHNMDYKECIELHDSKNTLFYIDPPYIGAEKVYKRLFNLDMSAFSLDELRQTLERVQGKFALSNFDTLAVREAFSNFRIIELQRSESVAGKSIVDGKKKVVREVLIMNY